MDYVLGKNGWNQSGRKVSSGSLELRLMNRSTLSVIKVSGVKTNLKEGDSASVTVIMQTGFSETLRSSYNTKVIATSEDLLWLKQEPSTCFIVKK